MAEKDAEKDAETESQRRVLTDLQAHAAGRIKRLESDLRDLMRARRDGSDDDEHDPEGVPLSSEWSRLTGLLEAARSNARQIDEAVVRLEEGSYGLCVGCGKPIPIERLEVRPFAESCVPCAS